MRHPHNERPTANVRRTVYRLLRAMSNKTGKRSKAATQATKNKRSPRRTALLYAPVKYWNA